MERSPGASSRVSIPRGLLGMLALIGLVESLVSRHEIDLKTGWHWQWRANGLAALTEAARCEVLCLGDSQVNHGIVPQVLEGRLGRRAYNLALSGGQAPTSYFQLRRALEAGARPSSLIVDFFPLLLNRGLEENELHWPDLLMARECLELAWAARDAPFFARTIIACYLPSCRVRTALRTNLLAALRGQGASERLEARAWMRSWRINRGSAVFPKAPNIVLGDLDRLFREPFRRAAFCAPSHGTFLLRFLELAAARRIPVFWLVPPIHPEAQRCLVLGGTDARHDRLLHRAMERFPNVFIIDGRRAGYEASIFVDTVHLDRQGASVFTADVGDIIKRVLKDGAPHGRWFELPAYRPEPLDATLEDIGQCRSIVRNSTEHQKLR